MPYQWQHPSPDSRRLTIWPHRSLPRTGFVWFIGATAALMSLPLLAVIGTAALWALLPFLIAAIAGLWWALQRSYGDGEVHERLTLTPDSITLKRVEPRGRQLEWSANPHWVRLHIYDTGGPVPSYLTLKGGGREVEIGAFLSVEERKALYGELRDALRPQTA